jgi:hypothetical protein
MVIFKRVRTLPLLSLMTGLFINAAVVDDAISRADAIVIGTIDAGTETDQNVSFDLSVVRVLKGKDIPSRVHVSHAWIRRGITFPSGPSAIDLPMHGVWLLTKTTGDTWDVLVVNGPDGILPNLCLPAAEQLPVPYQYSSSAAVVEKLVLEVGAGVQSAKIAPEQFLYSLGGLSSSAVDRILSDFLQSSSISFQTVGVSGLLSRNAPGSVSKLAKMWPVVRQSPNKSLIISALRDSFRDTSPESVQHLVVLANDPSSGQELRAAAIWALKAMHTKESVPFLASLLSSSDPGERVNAVIGLSSFANGCPVQTPANVASMEYMEFKKPSPYRTAETIAAFAFGPVDSERESELTAFWTGWWNEHKAGF